MAEGNLAVLPQFSPPVRVGAGIKVPNGPLGGLGAQKRAVLAANTRFVHLHVIDHSYGREWYICLYTHMHVYIISEEYYHGNFLYPLIIYTHIILHAHHSEDEQLCCVGPPLCSVAT